VSSTRPRGGKRRTHCDHEFADLKKGGGTRSLKGEGERNGVQIRGDLREGRGGEGESNFIPCPKKEG